MQTDLPVESSGARRPRIVAVDARTLSQTGKGIPRFLFETLRELAAIPTLKLILFSNRPLHVDNMLPIETVIDERWRKVPGTVWMMARLNRLAAEAGADTLWGPAHVLPFRTKRLRTVLTVHDLVYRIMPESMSLWNRCISRLLVDASIRRADRVVADSYSTKADIISSVGLKDGQINVVYLGARKAPRDLLQTPFHTEGRTEGDDYLFALGSIEPRKNIDGLLNCFNAIRQRVPGVSLRLTGAHSWSSARTLERIEDSGFCRILGFLSDREIAEQMAGARAFIMPSHYEGFGLPVIEAVDLAPIVTSDIPVFRELGRFIEGICFVDFSDAESAADTIAAFLATHPRPAQFAPGAKETFRWKSVAKGYADFFATHEADAKS